MEQDIGGLQDAWHFGLIAKAPPVDAILDPQRDSELTQVPVQRARSQKPDPTPRILSRFRAMRASAGRLRASNLPDTTKTTSSSPARPCERKLRRSSSPSNALVRNTRLSDTHGIQPSRAACAPRASQNF